MESFFRYISYIDLYYRQDKIKNAGFLRWKFQNGIHSINLQVNNANHLSGNFKIEERKTGRNIGNLLLDQGVGSFSKSFPSTSIDDNLYLNTENFQIPLENIESFYIELDSCHSLLVPITLPIEKNKNQTYLPNPKKELLVKSEKIPVELTDQTLKTEEHIIPPERNLPMKGIDNIPSSDSTDINFPQKEDQPELLEPLYEDKWQQLRQKYPKIHPFPSDVMFLSIKPEDFIIFQKEYQKLVQNSFLLHGFYNYGHLILGKLIDNENAPFYLGVPGVYYDREKQAAQMFGFIGFESTEQPVQAGSYGYYMIEVKI